MTLHAILHHQHEPKRTEIARAADRCQLSKAVKACSRAKVGHVIFRVNACGHEVIENVLGKPKVVTEGKYSALGVVYPADPSSSARGPRPPRPRAHGPAY